MEKILDIKDYFPLIGWIVTFVLGAVSAGLIVPRLTKKRKIIAWATMAETELIPKEMTEKLGIPVTLTVGAHQPKSLSVVQLRFGSGGNEIIENIPVAVKFGKDCQILNVRAAYDLGEYGKKLKWTEGQDRMDLEIPFLNPRQYFELEVLISNYERGAVDVDQAVPGIELKRQQASNWDLAISKSFARGLGLSFFGVRYDPTAQAMGEIADELKAIRRHMSADSNRKA